ncbi:hypothetical protein DXG01_001962 [Tephrocybe rancida]|nr:hypothetical protein DXG01_001962 [Tephrocybe rancida]
MQVHPAVPIILGLPWLHEANPDINWKAMTMSFGYSSNLVAISIIRARQTHVENVTDEEEPVTANPKSPNRPLLWGPDKEENTSDTTSDTNSTPESQEEEIVSNDETPPTKPQTESQQKPHSRSPPRPPTNYFPPNIPQNRYQGPRKSKSLLKQPEGADPGGETTIPSPDNEEEGPGETPNPDEGEEPEDIQDTTPDEEGRPNMQLIGAAAFALLLKDRTEAFQLHISPSHVSIFERESTEKHLPEPLKRTTLEKDPVPGQPT